MSNKYDDIIHLPHKQSTTRAHMSIYNRAAQFAPFAALVGYDDAIKESARLTEDKRELSESDAQRLNLQVASLAREIDEHPLVTVTYFLYDEKKSGGAYTEYTGNLKRIDEFERIFIFTDGSEIFMDDISKLESPIFTDSD